MVLDMIDKTYIQPESLKPGQSFDPIHYRDEYIQDVSNFRIYFVFFPLQRRGAK